MTKWLKTIDLSLRWYEGWTSDNIHEMGKWVAQQIKIAIKDWEDYEKYGFDLEEINQGKDSWYHEEVPIEWFNDRMTEFYDFCDKYRFWVEK